MCYEFHSWTRAGIIERADVPTATPEQSPDESTAYIEENSVLPEVLWEGHARLKFVLTNR
jgi:hypothetical protein